MLMLYLSMNIFKMPNPSSVINIDCRVANSARLPLSVVNGSVKDRKMLASQYSDSLRRGLDQISIGKRCTVQGYKNILADILGEDIRIEVKSLEDPRYQGYIRKEIDKKTSVNNLANIVMEKTDADIVGYSIYLPLSADGTIIENKYTALHEGRHLFDYFCNPKTINMRSIKYMYEDDKLDSFHKIYREFTQDYQPLLLHSSFKKQVREDLKKLSDEEAIDVLQSARQTISSEKNAYGDELRYMGTRPISNAYPLMNSMDFLLAMRYNQKYKFANELLAEKLKAVRATIRDQHQVPKD